MSTPKKSDRESTLHETQFLRSISALDLANLASALNPGKCQSEPQEALREAYVFFNLACHFAEQQAGKTILDYADTRLGDMALQIIGKAKSEQCEEEKLLFCPKGGMTDTVKDFLRVKTSRAVREKLTRFFNAVTTQPDHFWRHAERKASNGVTYWAFDKTMLEGLRKFERSIKREGGLKAVEKQKQKGHSSIPAKKTLRRRKT